MYWVVHPFRPRDFPRPLRCSSGFALGTSLGPREISRSSGMYNSIHPSSRQCTDTLYNFVIIFLIILPLCFLQQKTIYYTFICFTLSWFFSCPHIHSPDISKLSLFSLICVIHSCIAGKVVIRPLSTPPLTSSSSYSPSL